MPNAGHRAGAVSHIVCAGCRQGDTFYPQSEFSASSDPLQRGGMDRFSDYGDPKLRLYTADGQVIPQTSDKYIGVYATFKLPPDQADYRLTHRLERTDPAAPSVSTAWEFTSHGVVDDDETPEPYECVGTLLEGLADGPPSNTPCRPEPLIFLRYNLGLDLSNRAKAPGVHRFEVTAYRQPSTADRPDIAGLKLWVSDDGGDNWREALVRTLGDGRFEATVVYRPAHQRTSDTISIKAMAWDTAGNRVEQTIERAYTLTER